jgi:predicted Zn-dependent protease
MAPPPQSPRQSSIDELTVRWRSRPDAAATIALCEALRAGSGGARSLGALATLVEEVGARASHDHAGDATVLVATARMYMAAERLGDAQTVLVTAGKAAPRDGKVYRWLGEVLLRRGDAERAVRVFERAVQFGENDPETRLWGDRARIFKSMQATAGMRAVAAEVERTAPLEAPRPTMDSLTDTTTEVAVIKALPLGGDDDDDDDELTRRRAIIPREVQKPPPPPPAAGLPPPRPPLHSSTNTGTNVLALPLGGDEEPSVTAEFPRDPGTFGKRADEAETPPPFAPIGVMAPAPSPPPRDPFGVMHGRPPPVVPPRPMTPPTPPGAGAAPVTTEPRDVLDALEMAGIFEPATMGGAPAALWDTAAKKPRGGSLVALIVSTVLFVGGVVGTWVYVRDRRAKEHTEAEALVARVSETLDASRPADLPGAEQMLSRAFDLDSRSPRAALEWLRERALLGILKGGSDIAFEDAIVRAQDVGVKESDIAFARVASFLFQGDTVGAAALLPKWDEKAAKEPWYQVLAGATLARAGDVHAIDRFAAAAALDRGLVIAQIELARATALDGDAVRAADLARVLKDKLPGRPEGAALVALAWARDPAHTEVAPPEADQTMKNASELPAPLAFVPHAVRAVRAVPMRDWATAREEVDKGLTDADGPGVAAWLGSIALDAGDENLARKAALAAVSFSAVYPPARMLAARVALVGARLDEALKATEELDPTSPDVALVRGAVAYERLDLDGLARAIEAIHEELRRLPFLSTVEIAPDVLVARQLIAPDKLLDLAADEAPWSDLVAMDAALDQGSMDQADAIAARWQGTEERTLRAVRLARLLRYEAKLDDADAASLTALTDGTVTPRVLIERVFTLVARGKGGEAAPLLAKYPLVLGPLGTWLSAYVAASSGKVDDAKARVSTLEPPPPGAPLASRVIAASALAAMKDRHRATDLLKPILAAGYVGFDVQNAALAAGFKRVEHKGKPPTFDPP